MSALLLIRISSEQHLNDAVLDLFAANVGFDSRERPKGCRGKIYLPSKRINHDLTFMSLNTDYLAMFAM